jgi:putative spermidine/putrescine transport system substrate-binding protein
MMSRTRSTILGVSILATVGLLAGCAGAPAPAETDGSEPPVTLTFVAYGGVGQEAMIKAWQKPYTAEHPNVDFINTAPPDVAQVKAQVESNAVLWDVLATSPAAAEQNCGTLFEPLDFSDVDQSELIEFSVGECYIGNFVNASPLAYRTDAFPDGGPETIEDFFDTEKFPGQRGVLTNLQNGILEYGLLGDGVAADDLYPLDVDRSLEKWSEIRDVTTFAPNVGALQQAVAANQVDMFFLADSRLVPLLNDGQDLTIVWDVTVASVNAFAVPKGTAKKDAAEAFLATVVNPVAQAQIAEALGVQPVNTNAAPNLGENAAKLAVFSDVNTGETVVQDVPWYAANFNEISTQLTNWLAG